jgi:hypothetical protein
MDKQHHWQKDSKYYKLTLQPNLFGNLQWPTIPLFQQKSYGTMDAKYITTPLKASLLHHQILKLR